jgi:uncharacterized protein
MKYLKLKNGLNYDGTQINPLWALKNFNIKGSSIIAWIGPMNIESSKILDLEDANLEIKADEMIHFIIEHFDCQPANIRLCYHRQRLFIMIVKEKLEDKGLHIHRSGDDLFIESKKLTVSIATVSNSSMKIHLGINLTNIGTPKSVETIGILDCLAKDDLKIHNLIDDISKKYIKEILLIESDIAKTKVF